MRRKSGASVSQATRFVPVRKFSEFTNYTKMLREDAQALFYNY